jgi:hypothetical protein
MAGGQGSFVPQPLLQFLRSMLSSLRDLAPIVLVIAFFQLVVLQQPIPNLGQLLGGLALVVMGLTFFGDGPVSDRRDHGLCLRAQG